MLLSGAVSMDRAEQLRKWAKSVKLKIEEDGPFPDLEFEPSPKMNHSREIDNVGGSPWCEPCQSWHPKPRDKKHHAALRCFAPFEEKWKLNQLMCQLSFYL